MERLAFYFDSGICSGCKTCQIACKDKNDLATSINWRRVYEVTSGDWERKGNAWISNVKAYNISMSCNHCEDPICMRSCPAKAIRRSEQGIVLIEESKCMGCKYCEWTCPYSAPQFNKSKGIMSKCNLCFDYVEKDKNPSCVDACPTRALDFGDYEKLNHKYTNKEHLYPLPSDKITNPSMIISPHKDALCEENTNAQISNMEEI